MQHSAEDTPTYLFIPQLVYRCSRFGNVLIFRPHYMTILIVKNMCNIRSVITRCWIRINFHQCHHVCDRSDGHPRDNWKAEKHRHYGKDHVGNDMVYAWRAGFYRSTPQCSNTSEEKEKNIRSLMRHSKTLNRDETMHYYKSLCIKVKTLFNCFDWRLSQKKLFSISDNVISF